MPSTCTLFVVRHGETERNVLGIFNGQEDSPLTPKGIEQAKELGNEFENIHLDAAYSSDLARAIKTAEIILQQRNLNISTDKLLREKFCGKFEGKPQVWYKEELKKLLTQKNDFSEEAKWKAKPDPQMESSFDVAERFTKALLQIAQNHQNQTVLVVAHSGCIRSLLVQLGKFKLSELPMGSIGNCGYVKLLSDGTRLEIEATKGVNPR